MSLKPNTKRFDIEIDAEDYYINISSWNEWAVKNVSIDTPEDILISWRPIELSKVYDVESLKNISL